MFAKMYADMKYAAASLCDWNVRTAILIFTHSPLMLENLKNIRKKILFTIPTGARNSQLVASHPYTEKIVHPSLAWI